jgi:hypothetical protein
MRYVCLSILVEVIQLYLHDHCCAIFLPSESLFPRAAHSSGSYSPKTNLNLRINDLRIIGLLDNYINIEDYILIVPALLQLYWYLVC